MYQRVGTQFGIFAIRRLLGAGGMAAVYYAIDSTTHLPVALKILSSQLGAIETFRQRFELEAQITRRLSHPHIVPVINHGEFEGTLYLAMPYISGGSLHDKFVLEGAVSLRDTAGYLGQLAAALDYAHSQGIIHRDLKLANVLLDDQQNVLLSDFGIARILESSVHLTESGSVLGSPHYMSPEQSEGKPLDSRSDIYSLAVMTYLMITGQFPFHADTAVAIALQHITKPPLPPSSVNAALPSAVDAVLLKGLAKSASDRFGSANDMSAAFERAIGDCDTRTLISIPQLATLSPSPPALPLKDIATEPSLRKMSTRTPRKRRFFLVYALLILLIALLGAAKVGLPQFNGSALGASGTGQVSAVPITATPFPITIQAYSTPTPLPEFSVVIKDLYTPANVRSGPGINFRVVDQMYASDVSQVIARTQSLDTVWYLVRTTRGITGWISSTVVDLLPTSATPENVFIAVTIPPSPTPE